MPEYSVSVKLKARVEDFQRGMAEAAAAVKGLTSEIDHSSDRSAWLAQSILALAPAAETLGAGAVPAIAGVTTQMIVTAAAAGTLGLAFHGIGKALTALNTAQLTPTAANIAKLHAAMAKIGPEGDQFVHFLDSLGGQLGGLANTARAGVFPGLEDGIKHLLTMLPEVQDIVGKIGHGLGTLADEAGKGLAGPKFKAFFDWLDRDAKPILMDMGRTVGNLAEGLANMLVAFAPQSLGFSHGLLQMSRAFAEWSRSLDTNQGFQHFLAYIQEAAPKALAFLGALIDAGTAILRAWAPLGQATLPLLTHFLNILTALINTPLGPATLGILALASAYGRLRAIGEITSAGIFTKFNSGLVAQTKAANAARPTLDELSMAFQRNSAVSSMARGSIGRYVKGLAPAGLAIAGFGLLASGTADKFGLTNTAALTMAGTLVGPWGAAAGATVGLLLDLSKRSDGFKVNTAALTDTLNKNTGAITKNTSAYVAQQLQQQGVLDAASALDVKLSDVTQAALGNADAQARVGAQLDAYSASIAGSAVEQGNFADKAGLVEDAIGKSSDAIKNGKSAVAQLGAALNKTGHAQKVMSAQTAAAAEAAQTTGGQFITLGKSVDKAKVSLDKWIRQMEKEAQALTDFGNNAKKAADRGLRDGLIKQLETLGPAGALRMKQLADGTESQIKRANKAYLDGQKAIETYTSIVTGIPIAQLRVNTSGALRGINLVENAMRNLPSSKTITINERHTGGHSMYTGGFTGAGPKMEPRGVVHAGEVVIPQELVERDWAMLKARYGYLPGFAEGGYVGAQAANPGGGASKVMVTLDGMEVTGTLDTPWGPSTIRGIARSEATDVYHREKAADDRHREAMNV